MSASIPVPETTSVSETTPSQDHGKIIQAFRDNIESVQDGSKKYLHAMVDYLESQIKSDPKSSDVYIKHFMTKLVDLEDMIKQESHKKTLPKSEDESLAESEKTAAAVNDIIIKLTRSINIENKLGDTFKILTTLPLPDMINQCPRELLYGDSISEFIDAIFRVGYLDQPIPVEMLEDNPRNIPAYIWKNKVDIIQRRINLKFRDPPPSKEAHELISMLMNIYTELKLDNLPEEVYQRVDQWLLDNNNTAKSALKV